MKYVVSTLDGVLLDAAVEKAEGRMPDHGWDAPGMERTAAPMPGQCDPYSTDWAFGGPIIEREGISIMQLSEGPANPKWAANFEIGWHSQELDAPHVGPTPLIAAMRAYVASKFGDEVDL